MRKLIEDKFKLRNEIITFNLIYILIFFLYLMDVDIDTIFSFIYNCIISLFFILPFIPIFSSIVCGFFGRFLGFKGAKIISITLIGITCFESWFSFYYIGLLKQEIHFFLGNWINSDLLYVDWIFLYDSLSVTMLVVVTTVSFLVHIYSSSYMSEDPHLPRFMSYLSLFTFFMIILVTADNFLQLFLGWEGVGLCSYLLINFWFTRVQANKAAIKALVINKIGDFTLFVGILILNFTFKTLDFTSVFLLVPFFIEKKLFLFFNYFSVINIICIFLFIGAVGKSAQIGLHTWLPDAMEGPTPVSALIHAATMVTAGIFLIIRCSPLFEYAPLILNIITIIGGLTAFFAATIGLVQNDIKKIIAYSTCSQLGYMTFVCGLSNYTTGLFHLSNHAFFKALLFLSAGSVIHGLSNEQDIRKMGGIIKLMPTTYAMFLIGSLALAGFPFLSGFYSKDVILELAFTKYTVASLFAYWLGSLTAMFTAIYSFRLLYYVFYSKTNAYKQFIKNAHESPLAMLIPLFILSVGSIFSGYFSKDIFIGLGSDFFVDTIYILPQNNIIMDSEFIPVYIKLLPTILSLFGILICLLVLNYFEYFLIQLKNVKYYWFFYKFLIHKWYFDFIYNELIAKKFLIVSYEVCFKILDKGFVEIIGPKGFSSFFYKLSFNLRKQQTGFVFQYLNLMSLGILFIYYLVILI